MGLRVWFWGEIFSKKINKNSCAHKAPPPPNINKASQRVRLTIFFVFLIFVSFFPFFFCFSLSLFAIHFAPMGSLFLSSRISGTYHLLEELKNGQPEYKESSINLQIEYINTSNIKR